MSIAGACYSAGHCLLTEACHVRSEGRMRYSNVYFLKTCVYFSFLELGLFKLDRAHVLHGIHNCTPAGKRTS